MSCTKNGNEDFYHGKDQSDSASDDDGSSAPGRVRQLKKGPWTAAEDAILVEYVKNHGEGNWNAVQKRTTLLRCGKSCRLRWANHLRPNLKKGAFTAEEERLIIELHAIMGNKWARMAQQLPGRTDNEIKNYWNTRLKKISRQGLPLYPFQVNPQASHFQQPPNTCESGVASAHIDLPHVGDFHIPFVKFDGSRDTHISSSPNAAQFHEITPLNGISDQHFRYSQGYDYLIPSSVLNAKRIYDHGPSLTSFNGVTNCLVQHDPPFDHLQNDPFEKVQRPFSVNIWNETERNKRNAPPPQRPDSHAIQNGNFSASKPLSVAMKMELPSFQSFDNVHNNMDRLTTSPLSPEPVDTFIRSPPELSVQPCCTSTCGSGLLQDLIHGCSVPSSSTMPAETIDHYATNEPISGVNCFPVICECNLPACCSEMTPSIADGIHGSIMNSGGVEHVSDPKSDQKQASTEDLDSVDANYETMFNWYDGRSEFTKEGPIITDGIACFLDDDLLNYKQPDSESSSTMKEENVNESPGYGPLSWFKMTAICQMPDSSQE